MGVASYDPESGTWSDEGANESFNRNSGYERGGPEMGYKQPSQKPELDPRNYPQTDLQIIPVTPTREEDRKDRWQPGWKIEDVIKNGRLPPAKRTPVIN